ncbi:MAG: DHH family phosphoesterase [Thermoproteota archaeon]
MSIEEFRKDADKVISKLNASKEHFAVVVTHDDADGLSSGAIMKEALERSKFEVKVIFLEKIFPEVVKDLHSKYNLIFYTDIGSAHANLISSLNSKKSLTIILDHHNASGGENNNVYDLNLEKYGYKGETDFSGATIAYLFAKQLNSRNEDLVYLALVGSKEIPDGFLGINKDLVEEAERKGYIKKKGNDYSITKLNTTLGEMFSSLQILGSVGYYSQGPEIGIKAAISGIDTSIEEKIKSLEFKRKSANKKLIEALSKGSLKKLNRIQWFDASKFFKGMGTKVLGTFCSYLSYQTRIIDQDKYIVGIVDMPSEIPNWGKLEKEYCKISARAPKKLQELIRSKKSISVVDLLVKSSSPYGFADGHDFAASAIVTKGSEAEVIKKMDGL